MDKSDIFGLVHRDVWYRPPSVLEYSLHPFIVANPLLCTLKYIPAQSRTVGPIITVYHIYIAAVSREQATPVNHQQTLKCIVAFTMFP